MIVDDLVTRPGSWLSMEQDTGIVISSRVRLARNVFGSPFPGWAREKESTRMYARIRSALEQLESIKDPLMFDIAGLDPVDRDVLRERHLISNEFANKGAGSALMVAENEHIAIMINEEDHLRLQAISPGRNLDAIWKRINDVDSELEKYLQYAFSRTLGYLSACPTNVGTGLRASVMMHLSGLRLMDEIGQVIKGLEKMGFAVRGLLGEGSEAYGNMFQISNQSTLGEREEDIISQLNEISDELVRHEQNARMRLMEGRRSYVLDQIGRAFGVLVNAHILPSREAVDLLSGIRLGVEMGLVKNLTIAQLNEILLLTQPGHLQKMEKKTLGPGERDHVRARIVRNKLIAATIESNE